MPDALGQRLLTELDRAAAWAAVGGAPLFCSEYGWSGTTDSASWNTLGQLLLNRIDTYGIGACANYAGEYASESDTLTVYGRGAVGAPGVLTTVHPQAATMEAHLAANRGCNLAGGDRGNASFTAPVRQALIADFSNTRLGVFGTDYNYGQAGSFAFLAGRGHKVVRIPFRWERVQPTLGAALSSTEVGRIKAAVDLAVANGMTAIIDCHNYGGYFVEGGAGGVYHDIANSDAVVTQAHFVDLWTRMSAAFNGYTGIYAYELMNEPNFMQVGATGWQTISQAAVTAIRGASDTTWVHVSVYNGAVGQYGGGMGSIPSNHPAQWITDSASKTRYDGHIYPDTTALFTTPYEAQVGAAGLTYGLAVVPGVTLGRAVNRRRTRAWLSETFAETRARDWTLTGTATTTAWGAKIQATATNARITRTAKFSDFLAEWSMRIVQGTEVRFRFREVDSSNHYTVWLNGSGNQVSFQKVVAGSGTTFATLNVTAAQIADGSLRLAVRCVGSKITVFVDGKALTTATDTFQQTAKGFAFAAFNGTTGFAAFEVGTLDVTPLTGT